MFGLTYFWILSPFFHLGPSFIYYSQFNLSKSYFGIQSYYLMTFLSCFDKFHFYSCVLYKFWVSQFSCFDFKLRKIQIIPIKYPKHVEND